MFSSYKNILTFQIFMNQGMYFFFGLYNIEAISQIPEKKQCQVYSLFEVHCLILCISGFMPLYFESSEVVKKKQLQSYTA